MFAVKKSTANAEPPPSEAGRGEDRGVTEGQRGVPVPAEEATAQVGPVHGSELAGWQFNRKKHWLEKPILLEIPHLK